MPTTIDSPGLRRLGARLTACGGAAVVVCLLQAQVFSHDEGPTTTVSFDREIVRILNEHCVACHADNGLSFRLATHEDVYARAQAVKTAVLRRRMPPWSAVPAYGEFDNDNHLTRRELDFIVSWLNGGAPRNSECAPQSRTLNLADCEEASKRLRGEAKADPHFDHWRFGQPDVERPLPSFTIRSGSMSTSIVFDLGLSKARYVAAWEYRPADRRVTRAVTFRVEETGQWLGTWTPWRSYFALPAGSAYSLGTGTRIVAEMYHAGAGKQTVKGGTLGLSFAQPPVSAEPKDIVLELQDAATGRSAEKVVGSDIEALAAWIDPRLAGRAVDVFGVLPNGETKILLVVRNQGLDWPTPYVFKTPVWLPKGTRLVVTAKSGRPGPASGRSRVTIMATEGSVSRR